MKLTNRYRITYTFFCISLGTFIAYDHILGIITCGLGAITAMILEMYAREKVVRDNSKRNTSDWFAGFPFYRVN